MASGLLAGKSLLEMKLWERRLGFLVSGRIGKEVAIRARAFGMSIIAFDPYFDDSFASEHDVKRCSSMTKSYTILMLFHFTVFLTMKQKT
jgi:lactate dehydrogenase-like 2-hydroxyacid dehydrogenase